MRHLSIDIETFSEVDIRKAGLYRYVQSPSFQIILFAFSWDGEDPVVIDLLRGETVPEEIIRALYDPNVTKHADNAAFEFCALSKFYYTILEQWQCTMIHGMYCGYPAGLAAINVAMQLPDDKQKNATGKGLINYFCKPCKPTKANGHRSRNLPHHEPARWELFKAYCAQDVVAEMAVEDRLTPWPVPEEEWNLWHLDLQINSYGVNIDQRLVSQALNINAAVMHALEEEAVGISGLDNPNSVAQLKKWLEEESDLDVVDMKKASVKQMIKTTDNDTVKRVLEIRQEMSKTSIKKYTAMQEVICSDGRVRGLLQFYGANRTGRWAGRLIQVQNLPKNKIETLENARDLVKTGRLQAIRVIYGNVPDTLSQLIRTAFIPSEGRIFLVADFSAIEARVIAWLAGEQWRQDVFATHGKIYEASAAAMFNVPVELISKGHPEYELRAKGKVAELALGYQGGTAALIAMGALEMGLSEEELPDIVARWRKASPRIKDLWHTMQSCAIEAIKTGRSQIGRGITFTHEGLGEERFLTIRLPSGRKLFYVKPFLSKNQWDSDAIFFYQRDQTTGKWIKEQTYGGKITENVVQAIARDCLAVALQKLAAAGFQTVMHVHDEAIIDCPLAQADLEKACEIMGQPIPWAPGLLLRADGFSTKFYKKE